MCKPFWTSVAYKLSIYTIYYFMENCYSYNFFIDLKVKPVFLVCLQNCLVYTNSVDSTLDDNAGEDLQIQKQVVSYM